MRFLDFRAARTWPWLTALAAPFLAPPALSQPPAVVTTDGGHVQKSTFAGFDMGIEGTELSCDDEVTFLVRPIERAYVATVSERDDRQSQAFSFACQAARATGASVSHVFVPRRQRFEIAHFLLQQDDKVLFGKAFRDVDAAASWAEPEWTRFADRHGLGPRVHDAPGLPHVLLTTYIPMRPLSRVQSFLPSHRRKLLQRLADIHGMEAPRVPRAQPTPIGGAWQRLEEASQAHFEGPLSLPDLRARLSYIDARIERMPIVHTICHGDPAVGNTLLVDSLILYIDWEAAGWDDPYRDVARLVSHSQWPHEALPEILHEYLGRHGTWQELEHLALLVSAFDIDHYGAARAAQGADSPYVARFAKRVRRAPCVLSDMPAVRTVSMNGESL